MRGVALLLFAALAFQNCVSSVLVRYAKKGVPENQKFHNSSVVLHQELVKLAISLAIVFVEQRRATRSGAEDRPDSQDHLISHVFSNEFPRGKTKKVVELIKVRFKKIRKAVWTSDAWRIIIPACLYTVQSILGFMALNSMDPATYQCLSQIRLLFTTCLSVVVIGRVVVPFQWIVLCVMTLSLICVHLGKSERMVRVRKKSTTTPPGYNISIGFLNDDIHIEVRQWYAGMCVLLSCLATSYASVYLEWVMTSLRSTSVAARNVQLSIFGILFSCFSLYVLDIRPNFMLQRQSFDEGTCTLAPYYNIFLRTDAVPSLGEDNSECAKPFFVWERFDTVSTWAVILVQASGGLLIGFTMSISDSVMKCLASAVSTVVSAGIAYANDDFEYSWLSLVGGVTTLACSYMFNVSDRERKRRSKPK